MVKHVLKKGEVGDREMAESRRDRREDASVTISPEVVIDDHETSARERLIYKLIYLIHLLREQVAYLYRPI